MFRPGHHPLRVLAALGLLALGAGSALAWVQLNRKDQGGPDIGMRLSGNSITFVVEQDGSADIGDGSDLTAIRNSFNAINSITTSDAAVVDGGNFDFPSPVDDDTGIGSDGVNRIFFFDTDNNGDFGSGLAVAVFFFNPTTGVISQCDIAFNDRDFTWFAGTAPANSDLGGNVFDIWEVTNQEIQHCFGFEHTPVAGRFNASTGLQVRGGVSGDFSLQASLYPFATGTIEGRTFEPDDVAAFSTVYPSPTTNSTFGNISGTISRADSSGVKGAHVVAVPANDPTKPIVGDISGTGAGLSPGGYLLTGLSPGTYLVRIEPLVGTTNIFTQSNTFFTGFDTSFPPEFYSGGAESASDVTISTSDAAQVNVMAGTTTTGIDIVVNSSAAVLPPNDNFSSAAAIGSASFSQTVDTSAATTETGDPDPPCALGSRNHSVWFRVTTATSGTMTVDTIGSSYDTVLSTWTGSPGSFVAVPNGCNDDIDTAAGNFQSRVQFAATAGTTYSFMVTSFGSAAAGTLVFNFSYTGQVAGVGPIPSGNFLSLIPHSAVGGGYISRLFITNLTANSNALTINRITQGGTLVSSTPTTLAAAATMQVVDSESQRTSALTVNWFAIASEFPIAASVLFDFEGGSVGLDPNIRQAVGALASPELSAFTAPVRFDSSVGATIGLALANRNSSSTTVTMKLIDGNGTVVATDSLSVAAFSQTAFVVSDRPAFQSLVTGPGGFLGSLAVTTTDPTKPVAALVVGGVQTELFTLPVVSGTAR